MTRLHVALCLSLVVCLVVGCLITPRVTALSLNKKIIAENGNANDIDPADDTDQRGLQFRVSEATGQPESRETKAPPTTTPLSKLQIANILRRLSPLRMDTQDQLPFAFRERSLPPPLTGKTINVAFPATENIAAPGISDGELRVLRYSPEGDVPLAPNLSVTFSQAMVGVSSQEEAAANVPVRLLPQLPGKWRWVGTNTLLFEPHVRLPMATRYSATVPAGTRSQNGGQTASEVTWTFSTPPPTIKQKYPYDGSQSQARDTLMFIEFDQRVDPTAVLRNIKVRAEGTEISTRLATKEEIEADMALKDRIQNAEKDRWLAFRAVDAQTGATKLALPLDTNITVSVGSGTPSLEGPLRTEKAQEFAFRTYGPLKLIKGECGYNNNCTPSEMFRLTFNNQLQGLDASKIRIEPSIPRPETNIYGNWIGIGGMKQPDTTYRITIDKSVTDIFDQQLGKDETVTLTVGAMFPRFALSANGFSVLDPAAPRQVSLYSLNLKTVRISLYKPQPEDWFQFKSYVQMRAQRNQNMTIGMPGQLIYSRQLDLQTPGNQIAETIIDLTPAFTDKLGQAIVMVEAVNPAIDALHNPVIAWVQSTRIGLDAFADNDQLVAWANSLEDGAPLADVQLEALPAKLSATTGRNGLTRIDLKTSSTSTASLLVARRGNDVAILPENPEIWVAGSTWGHYARPDQLRWYVFDDRKLYRPGEEVHFKGWIRRVGTGSNGDIGPLEGVVKKLSYRVKDNSDNELLKGEVSVNALGGFDAAFKLPGNMSLGESEIEFTTETDVKGFKDKEFRHTFSVQEFRRPEYEVNARNETEGPIFVGSGADVSVAAKYFAGGGLQDADVKWRISSYQSSFTPPNRDDYTFGRWFPWWTSASYNSQDNHKEITGRTDATGQHRIRIDFDSVRPAMASTVFAQASVEDVNRQSWSSTATLLVHPAKLYVGLKSERTFIQKGEPLVVQAIVTDLDGQAIADREIKIRTVSHRWRQINGTWLQVDEEPQDCSVKSSTNAVPCTFAATDGGVYSVTATIHDDQGRPNETEMTFWVAGGAMPTRRDLAQEKVELIPDRRVYHPGETAQVLVQAPFYPADAVMTLRRSGIVKTEHFHMDGPTHTLRFPIEEGWLPNIHVQVDLVGAAERATDAKITVTPQPKGGTTALPTKRPAFASGNISLSIPPLSRTLKVTATPLKTTLVPGGLANVTVKVQDATGKSVAGSEIALVAVDESVLSLTNYQLEDPVKAFYRLREMETTDHHLRSSLRLATADELRRGDVIVANQIRELPINGRSLNNLVLLQPGAMVEYANVTSSQDESTTQITMRKNFNALAVFAPTLRTNANGIAQMQFKLPDNLTRYRVMAVAVAGGKMFGTGESAITARKLLMVRPSAPRFLNFGDSFELPIIVQNQTDAPLTVDVAARAMNAKFVESPRSMGQNKTPARSRVQPVDVGQSSAGLRVTVPANDRVEVRIPVATTKAGTARFQVAAVSGSWSDAAEIALPVWTPATTEAFATYGEVDEGTITQAVKAPAGVFKQFGGLQVQTSSTQLQQLTDAFLYLQHYPFMCSEQLASRIISVAALRDVLTAFKNPDLPAPQEIEASVVQDLKTLQGMQNYDGGFGFWRRHEESWPYLSIHVAHALARAKQKDFAVPNEMFEKSQRYLQSIESHIPKHYSESTRHAVIAYALYVRAQMEDRDPARARRLIAEAGLDKLSLESVGWLLSVLSSDTDSAAEVAAMRRLLGNRVSETAGTAHFVCSYDDGDYLILNSSRRADGVILEALIGDQPQNDLIPKIVRGLLGHRIKGRWENTQENVFILLALDRYFKTYEKVTPNFVTRVWLGEAYAGEQQFKGRSTDRQELKVPMNYLASKAATQNLVLSKIGDGRLYYRIGMNYAPEDLNLKAADYGFTVERTYEAIDKPDDVKRDADGTWHIKAGARVRVRLTMIAPGRRYHVALVDPMPAGLESLNPVLATTEVVPEDEQPTGVGEYGSRSIGYGWWRWRSVWFDHQNLRDERTEAFTALLWEGAYNYSYVARATTPGVFIVPPAKAEEMYHPETFGRGKTDRVVIE